MLDSLKQAQEQAKQQLENGDLGQDKYDALQREIIETEQALKSLEEEAVKSGTAVQNIAAAGEKIKKVGSGVESVGKTLTTGVTVPLVAAGTVAATKFAEVDKTMQLTNATMGNSEEQAELLNAAMKEAAANSTFGMSDAATASLNFARAGLTAEEAAAALAPAMNLAAGEGGNLDTVSGGLVATINGFHGSFDEASHYADVFASACNNSALDVDSLSEAMSIAAPIFAAAGYSVDDAALYMGVMANNGIDANVAATSLKTGLARLVSPAKDGAEMMDQLGISVTNADGTMKDSAQIQKELHDAFSNLSESEQIAAASAIFGKNQMAPWLALINTAPEEVSDLSDSLSNCSGTTNEMAEAMMSGFGGSIEQLKSSVDVLMTTIGELLAKYLAPVIQKITDIVSWLQNLSPEMQDKIVKIGLIAAAIGPLLVVIGKLMVGVGQLMTYAPQIAVGLTKVKGAFTALTGPIGIVIAIIAVLVAAFMHLWNTNDAFREAILATWQKIKDTISNFIEGIKERLAALGISFSDVTSAISAIWNGFCELLAPVFEGAFNIIASVLQAMLGVITGILDVFIGLFTGNWQQLWTGIKEIFSSVWEGIKGILSAVLGMLQGLVDAFLGWFGTDWTTVWTGIKTFFEGVWNGIVSFFTGIWTGIKGVVTGALTAIQTGITTAFNAIKTTITTILTAIQTVMSTIWNAISGALGTVWETMKNIVKTGILFIKELISAAFQILTIPWQFIWQNFGSYLTTAWETIKSIISTALTAIKTTISTVWNAIKTLLQPILLAIQTAITTAWNAIKLTITTVLTAIKTVVTTVWNAIKTVITTVLNAIKTVITTVWNAIKATVSTVLTAIKTVVSTAWNGIKSTISSVMNSVKSVVTSAWNGIKSSVTSVLNSLKSSVSSIWNGIKSTISSVVNSIKSTISSGFNAAKSTATSIFNSIKNAITTLINAAKTAVQNAINRIKSAFNFSWSLPHLKLPHLSISGSFSINPPSVPHFSISWYKKAMDGGMILNSPTIFGMKGNKLLAGGEAGSEAVVGTNSLMDMIQSAVQRTNEAVQNINYGGVTINVYGAQGQDVSELADIIEERINMNVARKGAIFA